jgi:lipoate-protein ligase B
VRWAWLGRIRHAAATELQEALREAILAGRADETLLLCEHDAVVSLGRSAHREHLLVSENELGRRGIDLARASRGGDVTYHGPGQLVGYPVFRVRSVVGHVETMVDVLANVVARYGVDARWRRDCPGLWVGSAKLAAVGVHIHRRVAIHGFALNVSTPPEAFSVIVPCGLSQAQVTSLAGLGVTPPPLERLADEVARAFAARLGRPGVSIAPSQLLSR